jgi:rhamnosyltransferase
MEKVHMKSSTAAIVVTFYPPRDFYEHLVSSVIPQVDRVIVVDNTPTPSEVLQSIHDERVILLSNKSNIGLAQAQNLGISLAISMGYEWVLLLDQDSRPAPDFMDSMQDHYNSLTPGEKENLLMLAPNICDKLGGFFYPRIIRSRFGFKRIHCEHGKVIRNALIAISSGSLIPVRSFQRIGFMDDDFFIDYVDNDFCLRGISRGLTIHIVCNALLFHRLGNVRKTYSLGRLVVRSSFHEPARRYFIYRNRIRVWKRYFKKVPEFVLYDFMALAYDLVRIAFMEDNPREKLKAAFKGMIDGWKLQ